MDWPKEAQPDLGDGETNPHKQPEGCYGRRQTFRNDFHQAKLLFEQSLNRPVNNGGKESSLHALAQSLVDKTLVWDSDTDGITVKKVAILMTDRGYGNISNPGNRTEYVGDGSDRCVTSKPATIQKVGEMLKQHEVAVIGLLPFGSYEPDVLQTYEQYFQQMPGVPFCGKTFNMATETTKETILSSILSCFQQVC